MPQSTPPRRSPLSARALLLGFGMVAIIAWGTPFSIWIVGSSEITWSYFPLGVGVPFLAIVFGNALLKCWRPAWALAPAEFVGVLSMGLVVSGIPNFTIGYLFAVTSKPYYGATPENEWEAYVQPYLPDWAIPHTEGEGLRHFHEGLPSGATIPYEMWIGPLAWWLSLLVAVYVICFCLVVIMRRQWIDHERLVFPLTEVPRLLLEERPGSAMPPVFSSRAFWIGVAVPVAIILFNVIGFFQPGFPQLAIYQDNPVQLAQSLPSLNLIVYFPVVGFAYLAGTAISFSVWFFYLVAVLETGLVNWAGLTTLPDPFVWGSTPTLSWQGFGAFAAMVLLSLWMARHHLAAVARKAWRHHPELDDSNELMPYRAAVLGLLASSAYALGWLCRSGMALPVAALYLAGVLVIYLGITRLVIQSGIYYVTTPLASQALTLAVTGTTVAPSNLVALALSYSWCGDIQSVFMPSAAHAARLNELCSQRRHLSIAIGLAVVVGFVLSCYIMLHLCYEYGAGNFRSWIFAPGAGAAGIAFDAVVRQMREPLATDWGKLGYFGLGAAVYAVLSLFQYRFHWWPLHPVGLALASVWMIQRVAFSVFLAWLFKNAVLRLGGITLYRQLRPFFIGLIVGFFVGVGLSYTVDVIWFYGKGHFILNG